MVVIDLKLKKCFLHTEIKQLRVFVTKLRKFFHSHKNFDVFTSERLIGMVRKRCLELRVVQPMAWMPRPKVSAYFIVK